MSKIKVIETAEYSSRENLFYEDKGDKVCLHDDVKGELGWFKVFYDTEQGGRKYITVNHEMIHLDTLDKLPWT